MRIKIVFRKISIVLTAIIFTTNVLVSPKVYAQSPLSYLGMPMPGTMISPSQVFTPALLKGLTIDPQNPLHFNFIIDPGESGKVDESLRAEAEKLIRYFMASLTVPENELWVNLSPAEEDRIIPEQFGQTEMGRDLLAQDYILKQLTASLMYPEKELGKQFWDKLRQKALEQFGVSDIPVEAFNKVWIVPDKALVYENGQTAFIVESRLKVMLEEDYLMTQHATTDDGRQTTDDSSLVPRPSSFVANAVMRELIIPAIEEEINTGENFAPLRQIYQSTILATWFKRKLKNVVEATGRSSLRDVYVDQNKITGIDIEDKNIKDKIYEQYIQAFKKGAFELIKEEYDPATQQVTPRTYISGGAQFGESVDRAITITRELPRELAQVSVFDVSVDFKPFDHAMTTRNYSFSENLQLMNMLYYELKDDMPGIKLSVDNDRARIRIYDGRDPLVESRINMDGRIQVQVLESKYVKYVINLIMEGTHYQLNTVDDLFTHEIIIGVDKQDAKEIPANWRKDIEVDGQIINGIETYVSLMLDNDEIEYDVARLNDDELRLAASILSFIRTKDMNASLNILTSDEVPQITAEEAQELLDAINEDNADGQDLFNLSRGVIEMELQMRQEYALSERYFEPQTNSPLETLMTNGIKALVKIANGDSSLGRTSDAAMVAEALDKEDILELSTQLPQWDWANASKVIWSELIRFPKAQPAPENENQLNYFNNQAQVRKAMVYVMRDLALGQLNDPNEFVQRFQTIHRILLMGERGDSLYTSTTFQDQESKHQEILRTAGKLMDFDDNYATRNLIELFQKLKNYISLDRKTVSKEQRLTNIAEIYRDLISGRNIFPWGNHSWQMQLVNTLLRMEGLNGIPQGAMDIFVKTEDGWNLDVTGHILDDIKKNNPQLTFDAAMVSLSEKDLEQFTLDIPYWDWKRAMGIPWGELIRDLLKQPAPDLSDENTRTYIQNHRLARDKFLILMHTMATEGDISEEAFKTILADLNKTLLTGSGIYLTPSIPLRSDVPKEKEELRRYVQLIAGKYRNPTEITDRQLKVLRNQFRDFINASRQSQDKRELVKLIAKIYRTSISVNEGGFVDLYFFEMGNNSLFFSMVNAMLRLIGLNGMSHGELDHGSASFTGDDYIFSNPYFEKTFMKMVQAANPEIPLQEDPSTESNYYDPAMTAQNPGGIDLDPAQMELQVQKEGAGVDFNITPDQLLNMDIQGFVPIIINITPISNLPFLLGATQPEPAPAPQLSYFLKE